MAERERIANYFAALSAAEPGSFLLTDDAALLTSPPGQSIVITTDSVIAGIHLPVDAKPHHFAQKLVRRNLSDLAAMGAVPWRYLLNLHTPPGLGDDWIAQFAAALAEEQRLFGMVLVGGDTTSSEAPIHFTLTCLGLANDTTLRRNGAYVDDDVYVSGTLGDAAYALYQLQHNMAIEEALFQRYVAPTPRLELGQMLVGIATSAIDISDGLLADLSQLLQASKVGANLVRDILPLHPYVANIIAKDANAWRFPLSGGDDYELLFTASPEQRTRIEAIAQAVQLPLTRIGIITSALGITLRDAKGEIIPLPELGWEYR